MPRTVRLLTAAFENLHPAWHVINVSMEITIQLNWHVKCVSVLVHGVLMKEMKSMHRVIAATQQIQRVWTSVSFKTSKPSDWRKTNIKSHQWFKAEPGCFLWRKIKQGKYYSFTFHYIACPRCLIPFLCSTSIFFRTAENVPSDRITEMKLYKYANMLIRHKRYVHKNLFTSAFLLRRVPRVQSLLLTAWSALMPPPTICLSFRWKFIR